MILSRCLKIIEYVHSTLFFALIIPLLYAVTEWSDPAGAGIFYMKCLLVAVPVVVTERAVKRTKSLVTYLAICMALTAGILCVTKLFGSSGAFAVCYRIGITVETVVIAAKRFQYRVKDARLEERDPLAGKEPEFLNTPSLSLLWYFVVMYVLGICLNAKPLCDMAFYSAIPYFFLTLVYTYFRATRSYLEINKRTKGIPQRRLYGISFSMLLIFQTLLLVGILPSVFLAGQRQYTDIRHWLDDVELVPYEYESNAEFEGVSSGGMGMMELLNDGEPAPEPSVFMNTIFWVFGGVCILALVYGIFQMIRQVFRDFRNSHDENGDLIEEIKDKEKSDKDEISRKGRRDRGGEAEKIKRRYRKTIRKHRKDRPAPYESPTEIETYAGLKDDEQMQQLHKAYEKVRYSEFCFAKNAPDP